MLKIYNTLAREKQEFKPIEPGKVRMYVCGMTVYDYCHLGHARVMVIFDVVQRWLRSSGLDVTYVRNITDIDDKIIKRAQENGETMGQLTERFIHAMDEDSAALGVQRPEACGDKPAPAPLGFGALDSFGLRKFEDVFDQRVAAALQRLGLPSAQELQALRDEVQHLRSQLAAVAAGTRDTQRKR